MSEPTPQNVKSSHQNVIINLPADPHARKGIPVMTGVLDYFPAAIAEVAKVSKIANEQHNPGEPLHWARGKSTDHSDTIVRHLMQRGTLDTDGMRHSAKVAWRALALLQEELEAEAGFDPNRKPVDPAPLGKKCTCTGPPYPPDSTCPIHGVEPSKETHGAAF